MEPDVVKPGSMAAMVVWLLRLLLPLLLLWFWYRTQASQESGENVYHRDFLLAVKEVTEEPKEGEVPDAIRRMRLAPDAQVQKVFGPTPARGTPGQRLRQPSGNKFASQSSPGPTPKIPEKQARLTPEKLVVDDASAFGSLGMGAAAVPLASGKAALTGKELAQYEALLNFVAFGYRDKPQRVFLSEGPPPPPPRRTAAEEPDEAKANDHAQVVLRGAVNPKLDLKCADVATGIAEQLADSGVRPSEVTYSLMVESFVKAGNLRGASSILMRMESAGHSADPELLDGVMELFAKEQTSGAGAGDDDD